MKAIRTIDELFYSDFINPWAGLFLHFLSGADKADLGNKWESAMQEVRLCLQEWQIESFAVRNPDVEIPPGSSVEEVIRFVDELACVINVTHRRMSGEDFVDMYLQVVDKICPHLRKQELEQLRMHGLTPVFYGR